MSKINLVSTALLETRISDVIGYVRNVEIEYIVKRIDRQLER